MIFEFRDLEPVPGDCVYIRSEYSLGFDLALGTDADALVGDGGQTSIALGTLQVEVAAATGRALFVWGYHPSMSWVAGAAEPASMRPGAVFVTFERVFTPGVSIGLAETDEWTTTLDRETGWVRVSSTNYVEDELTVLIATNTGLGLVGNRLNSIWLRPTFVDEPPPERKPH